jgi:hypothetical protein
MKGPEARPSNVRRRRGPSRLLVAAILLPALAFVGYLAYWAYTVTDWTWFGLLLAAGLGLLVFAAAPDLFSLSDAEQPQAPADWSIPMSVPKPPGSAVSRASTAGVVQKSVAPPDAKLPNRTA